MDPSHDAGSYTGTTPPLDSTGSNLQIGRKFDVTNISLSYERRLVSAAGIVLDDAKLSPDSIDYEMPSSLSISPAGENGGPFQSNLRIRDDSTQMLGVNGGKYVYYLYPISAKVFADNNGFTTDFAYRISVPTQAIKTYSIAFHEILLTNAAGVVTSSLGLTPQDEHQIEDEVNRIFGQVDVNFSGGFTPFPTSDSTIWNVPTANFYDMEVTPFYKVTRSTYVQNAINVYFVNTLPDGLNGRTTPKIPLDNPGCVVEAGGAFSGTAHKDPSIIARIVAHELMHNLLNKGDSGHSSDPWNVFRGGELNSLNNSVITITQRNLFW